MYMYELIILKETNQFDFDVTYNEMAKILKSDESKIKFQPFARYAIAFCL
jgi:hypothetical protein